MRRAVWLSAGAVGLLVVVVLGIVVATAGSEPATLSGSDVPTNTATVEQGDLAAVVSQSGTLTYRARADGSPWPAVNQASGIYTQLPENGDKVDCGGVLYRVDDAPVVLLCGPVPAYRELEVGVAGQDVRQLNQNLHRLGFATGTALAPDAATFTADTRAALEKFQRDKGFPVTGTLAFGDAVFLAEPARVAKVEAQVGGAAQPGALVLAATSDTLHVQVDLDPSQQGEVEKGDAVSITLPGSTQVTGKVEAFGRLARLPDDPDSEPADATIPTYITLDDPAQASGLDQAPVSVDITTEGVPNALSVPVTALVGKSGGGFAVEVVRPDGRRDLVAVQLGLFDSGGGRVQVEGDLRAGDVVVVPSL